jgi:hypothetical protein
MTSDQRLSMLSAIRAPRHLTLPDPDLDSDLPAAGHHEQWRFQRLPVGMRFILLRRGNVEEYEASEDWSPLHVGEMLRP